MKLPAPVERSVLVLVAIVAVLLATPCASRAQEPARPMQGLAGLSPETLAEIVRGAQPDTPAALVFANREIIVFRAAILGRSSAGRAEAASTMLRQFTDSTRAFVVANRAVAGGLVVSVGDRDVLAIVPTDVDPLLGETLEGKGDLAVQRLQQALDETLEARRPVTLLWGAAQALAATLLFVLILWALERIRRAASASVTRGMAERLAGSQVADEIVRKTSVVRYMAHAITIITGISWLVVSYLWLTFVLRRFPYTRPLGESLRGFLIERLEWCLAGIVAAMPSMLTIAIIVLITRAVIQIVHHLFDAVEQGRITIPWIHPETATTTGRLMSALLWLFALAVSYPFLPGSDTDAFKGISVFIGLMVSLGSSGLVNQVMSGFTVTYSRALRPGDFVRVGDIEGTVTHIGTLSTKLDTARREEVTIPNAVLVSQTVVNFSRNTESSGVYTPTAVTIGYDAPWRQIKALLLLAAERTAGIREEPPPLVLQTGLEDFYVRYTLLVALEQPQLRTRVLDVLHANIQDAFNEHGVQIMSPNYEADPSGPKVVPRDRWFAEPAVDPGDSSIRRRGPAR